MSRLALLALPLFALLLLAQARLAGAEDPYVAWSQGRPADAIADLHRRALADDRWDAWFDLGLAAAAAQQRGKAVAWLLEARRRAPQRSEPREALATIGAAPPGGWLDRLGPLVWPGIGWRGVALWAVGGLALGYALLGRRRRPALMIAALAIAAAAPGQLATIIDQRLDLVAIVSDTQLLDSSGTPRQAVAAGTIAVREPREPWSGRILIRLADGERGYVPIADTVAKP